MSGAVESQLKVERAVSGEVIVTVELAKDFAEGTEIVSRLERVELGTDIDGDPITSLVVVAAEASPSTRNITRRLSDRQRLALAALDECAAVSGQAAPADLQLPARTIVVQLSAWREELYLPLPGSSSKRDMWRSVLGRTGMTRGGSTSYLT